MKGRLFSTTSRLRERLVFTFRFEDIIFTPVNATFSVASRYIIYIHFEKKMKWIELIFLLPSDDQGVTDCW